MKRLLLATCCLVSAAPPATAQLLERETRPDRAPPGLEALPAPEVDVTGVWFHIRRGERTAAADELARLQEEYPAWEPPTDLLEAIFAPEPEAPVAAPAEPAPLPPRLAAALEGKPPAPGDAERLRGWELLEAGRPAAALGAFTQARAAGAGRDATLGRLRALIALERLREARALARDQGLVSEVAADLAGLHARYALNAAPNAPAAALGLAEQAEALGAEAPWEALGWAMLDAGHAPPAATAFARADGVEALYGRVLALGRAGRETAATDLACETADRDPRLAQACRDTLLETAGAASDAEDWPAVLAATQRLRTAGLADAASEELRAWALYNTGRPAEARDIFATLHAEAPTRATAEALMAAARAAGEDDATLAARVAGPDDPLATVLREATSDTAYARGLFVAAETLAPGRHPGVGGVDRPYGRAEVTRRSKDGEPGQGRVEATTLSVRGGTVFDGDRLTLGLDTTWIGNEGPDVIAPDATLFEPSVTWSREGVPLSLAVGLGATPIGGEVSPLPTGSVTARLDGESMTATGAVFAESRRDSLLALSGQTDPLTGESFGRVVESGASASVTVLPVDRVGITASALGSVLTGRNVADNTRLRLGLSASYDVPLEGFAYWRIGPYVSWQRYSENLGQYTPGHGGYFSPQSNVSAGLALDALTERGRDWQVGARATLGWTYSEEEAAPFFPEGAPDPALVGIYDAVENRGLAGDIALRGGLMLSDDWMLTGLASVGFAPDYEETVIGVGVRHTFGSRDAILDTDLPERRVGR